MTGFLVFAVIVVAIVILFRYWRKREMDAFMGADVADFEELSELAAQTQLVETAARDTNVVSIPAREHDRQPVPGFTLKPAVLDEVHRDCLQALESATPDQYRILVHVPMDDIARPEQKGDEARLRSHRVSFALCEKASMALTCGVLLKGAGQTERARAEFVEAVFHQIGRPLIVLPVTTGYSVLEIREALAGVLEDSPVERHCPKCGKEMMMRKAVRGRNAGKSFWVCKEFPSCKGIMRI